MSTNRSVDVGLFYYCYSNFFFHSKCIPKYISLSTIPFLALLIQVTGLLLGFGVGFSGFVIFFQEFKTVHFHLVANPFLSPEMEGNTFVAIWTFLLEKEKPSKSCKEINFTLS